MSRARTSPVRPSPNARHRHRHRLLSVLVGLAVAATAFVLSPSTPAGAWEVERTEGKVLFTSNRMHANTVRVTVIIALYENGNYEHRVEVHNGARIRKTFRATGQVYLPGMTLVSEYDTGERDIEGRRNDEWDTYYQRGWDPRIRDRFAAVDEGTPGAEFTLHAGRRGSGGGGGPSACSQPGPNYQSVCEAQTRPPNMD